ncbi:hypothetical protein [Leeuwenhoekiella marinoflava]|uniref:Uncharacterized protein n=2 Tax=Leeuwenhoekiella marinoflava TaxID=988 RepID=A0A4V1KSE0_9FLAO|nr:hypothetical protein [Leeuwenhoekiella marinoflava]RXG30659.1 hypothetical protein DSL99_1701 [Leeuwenhoekiella marinoflava]SHF20489.1 hypothetical protein SAMN02745246_01956 [Leeuwenhoekiella marinoflava DSM 3653]
MKHIIDLNSEIEKIVNPVVEYHNKYENISFFGNWVNDMPDNFFSSWEEKIKDKIDKVADIDNPIKIQVTKVIHQDVLEKYKEQLELNFNDLEFLKTLQHFYYRDKELDAPKYKPMEFRYYPNSTFGDSIQKLAQINGIDDFHYYDADNSPDGYRDELEDMILDKYGLIEANSKIQDEKINQLYAYLFLSDCLESTRQMLKRIAEYLDSFVGFIKKAENFELDKYSFEEISDKDPTNLKLEFKIQKLDVAFFYRALFEGGILDVDSQNQINKDTNLRKYIDNANIYFLNEKGDSVKIKDISKEFSRIKKKEDEVYKYSRQEIDLLDLIIKKFSNRREKILQEM